MSTSEPTPSVIDYESPHPEVKGRRRNWFIPFALTASTLLFFTMLGLLFWQSIIKAPASSYGLILAVGGPEDEGTRIIITGSSQLDKVSGTIEKASGYTWRTNVPSGRYTIEVDHPRRTFDSRQCIVPERQRVLVALDRWYSRTTPPAQRNAE